MVAQRRRPALLVRQPREAVASRRCSSSRRASSTTGEEPLDHGQARAGRGDRQGRPRVAAPHELLHLARVHRREVPRVSWPRTSTTEPDEDPGENERIEIVALPLEQAGRGDRASRRTRRRSSGCSGCGPTCTDAGVAPARVKAGRGRTHLRGDDRPQISEARPFEHLVLDFLAYLEFERGLSRNTLEAYRSDLFQYGRFLAERRRVGARRRERRRGRLPDRAGRRRRQRRHRPRRPRSTARAACLRSFYRHLRREGYATRTRWPRSSAHGAGASCRRCSPAERWASCWRRRRAPTRRAARPRAARADVCLRAARLGGDRDRGGRRGPRGRRPARARQGLEGARGADRQHGRRGGGAATSSAAGRCW